MKRNYLVAGEVLITRGAIRLWLDRVVAMVLAITTAGSILCFGGQVWWYPLALAACASLVTLATISRWLIAARGEVPRSPWILIGICMLIIALIQITPLPLHPASGLSPRGSGALARLDAQATGAVRDDPVLVPESQGQVVLSADRSATLRCMTHGLALFAIFCVVATSTDRIQRTKLVWNSLIAGFLLTTAVAVLQLFGESPGAY